MSTLVQDKKFQWEFLEGLDWVEAMKTCPQDPIWHAEGDVYIHTQMVTDQLLNFPEYEKLSSKEQYILLMTAIMHDIGKPLCTQTAENGRIIAPRHARLSEKMARQLLWNLDFDLRETICAYVRWHGWPLWGYQKYNPNANVIKTSLSVNNHHLGLFAKADVLGRIGEDLDDLQDRIDDFQLLCEEFDCWEQPFQFHNEHSQFRFFYKNDEYPAQLYDDTEFTVYILSGLPGSGKDTYAAQLDLPMISLDDIRALLKIKFTDKKGQGKVAQHAYTLAKRYAAKKQSFVWNSTNLTKDMRARIIHSLSVYNPRFEIIYLETSYENTLKRRRETIKRQKLEGMFRILEMPQRSEAHKVTYIRAD